MKFTFRGDTQRKCLIVLAVLAMILILQFTVMQLYAWWTPTKALQRQVYAEHEQLHRATNDVLEIVDEESGCSMGMVWFLPTRVCTYKIDISHAGKTKAEVRDVLLDSGWIEYKDGIYKHDFECRAAINDSTGWSEYFKNKQSDYDKVTFSLICSKGVLS